MKAVSMRNKHVAYLIASWVINSHLYSLPKFKKVSVRDVSSLRHLKSLLIAKKRSELLKKKSFGAKMRKKQRELQNEYAKEEKEKEARKAAKAQEKKKQEQAKKITK